MPSTDKQRKWLSPVFCNLTLQSREMAHLCTLKLENSEQRLKLEFNNKKHEKIA